MQDVSIAVLEMLFLQKNGEQPTSKEVVAAFKQKHSQR
jgi:hypothetical protein